MAAEERENGEEIRVSAQRENPNVDGERCSGSCSSSSETFLGDDSKCQADRMVKIELDAARALADFAQLALLESENPSVEPGGKWGNKGRRSRKRVKNDSPARDWGKNLESSKLKLSDLVQDHSLENQRRHKKVCKNVTIKTVKSEPDSELPRPTAMCSSSFVSYGGSKSKQNLTEAEREARRLRRVLANRESARQTIRRRQAMCEELNRKAADLAWDNESIKREKELVMKEYQSLKDTNKHLKAQMARTIKTEVEETSVETTSTQVEAPASSSEKLPLLVYNRPPFSPFIWPSIIRPLNPVQSQCIPQNATKSQDPMAATCKPDPSHEHGNSPSTNGPRTPFYILPCPWFYPLPDLGNGLHPHPLDSCGSRDKRDDISVDNQHDTGSSSIAMGNVENHRPSLPGKVKTDSSSSTEANPINNLPEASNGFPANGRGNFLGHPKGVILMPAPLRSVKPTITVKCENGLQQNSTSKEESVSSAGGHVSSALLRDMQGSRVYPSNKLVDAAAAAEARKRRKELTKLKNFRRRQRQLRLRCS